MSRQANAQRIGAYAWCLILTLAGGALIIGALGGSPGEEPGTVLAEKGTLLPVIAVDRDGDLYNRGDAGISHVSNPSDP